MPFPTSKTVGGLCSRYISWSSGSARRQPGISTPARRHSANRGQEIKRNVVAGRRSEPLSLSNRQDSRSQFGARWIRLGNERARPVAGTSIAVHTVRYRGKAEWVRHPGGRPGGVRSVSEGRRTNEGHQSKEVEGNNAPMGILVKGSVGSAVDQQHEVRISILSCVAVGPPNLAAAFREGAHIGSVAGALVYVHGCVAPPVSIVRAVGGVGPEPDSV